MQFNATRRQQAGLQSADVSAALAGSGPTSQQTDLFVSLFTDVFALFDIRHTEPTRRWQDSTVGGAYWGPLNPSGRPHGRGLLIRKQDIPDALSVSCCFGDFAHGQVVYAQRWWSSGSDDFYEGDVAGAKKHGFGRLRRTRDALPFYEGGFRNNRRHGLSMERQAGGEIYLGWFARGRREGPGYWQTLQGTRVAGRHQRGVPKPPLAAVLSGERGVWHGALRGDDPWGRGTLRRGDHEITGHGKGLTRRQQDLPAPQVAVMHPAGHVIFAAHPELLDDAFPDVEAFTEAMLNDRRDVVEAILTRWRQLSPEAAKQLLQTAGRQQRTALHVACLGSQVDVVESLLALGADVHASTLTGVQPLHLACGLNEAIPRILDQLLSNPTFYALYTGERCALTQANMRAADREVIARYRGTCRAVSVEVVAALLRAGAEPQTVTQYVCPIVTPGAQGSQPRLAHVGITAFEIAALAGHHEVVTMMLDRHDGLFANRRLRETAILMTTVADDAALTQTLLNARGQRFR